MTDRELERKLADAVSHTAPDDLEGVLSRCETRKGTVIPMKKVNYGSAARKMIAACLAVMLVGGGTLAAGYRQDRVVSSVVSLDVNPSIELQVNRKEKVLACRALNEDARTVLAEMAEGEDLEGAKLDVAVNAIVGALVRHGYLESVSSAILISVEDQDRERADRLRQELEEAVDQALQSQSAGAAVLAQTVDADEQLQQQAEECGISAGKAALVERVAAQNSGLAFEDLAALSVEELKALAAAGAPAVPIGKAAAETAAKAFAGVQETAGVQSEVYPELGKTPAHYVVKLNTLFGWFEYKVDAYTGKVLGGRADVPQTAGQSTAAPSAGTDIGGEVAKSTALSHAGVKESAVTDLKVERDVHNGAVEYEVEFTAGGVEYEYTVSGDGTILDAERKVKSSDKQTASAGTDIGGEKAKSAALSHAGVKESAVTDLKVERDIHDGAVEYEVEFTANGVEYEYTVSGDGTILEAEADHGGSKEKNKEKDHDDHDDPDDDHDDDD
ncbi:PepSY domain-containing protein [Dysosmobacter sp.]|uniref:PepSY domain-containing protein n=1 Tax=Dysosmobacter sp. TaxID=2591382 RepID=UPI002A856FF2|nr:PepSY domain-containing protein [Dysosmobacter sp.]MDY3282606.1 PepSY domain-containing protein [Dysosmobacter sp.]